MSPSDLTNDNATIRFRNIKETMTIPQIKDMLDIPETKQWEAELNFIMHQKLEDC
jgi:hypothetical protein